jgi:hypothetical protein
MLEMRDIDDLDAKILDGILEPPIWAQVKPYYKCVVLAINFSTME